MDISFVQYNHELEEFANQVTEKSRYHFVGAFYL